MKTSPVFPYFSDLDALLRQNAAAYRTETAVREKRDGFYQNVSYAKLYDEAQALAAALLTRLPAGGHVLLAGENGYGFLLGFFALSRAGFLPILTDPAAKPAALRALAAKVKACAVAYPQNAAERYEKTPKAAHLSFACFPALVREGKARLAERETELFKTPAPADPAVGFADETGNVPLLSHRGLCFAAAAAADVLSLGARDVMLSVLPPHRAAALVSGCLAPLSRGAAIAFAEDAGHFLRNAREVHPTACAVTPLFVSALAKRLADTIPDEDKVAARRATALTNAVVLAASRQNIKEKLFAEQRALFGGRLARLLVFGAPDADAARTLADFGVAVFPAYGTPACAGLIAANRPKRRRAGTLGTAFAGATLDIYNVQPDGSGDVRYKGPNVTLGYLADPKKTVQAVHRGWFYTGDVGRADQDGFLTVIGRRSARVETAHGLVSPEELEKLLAKSPLFAEVCVVGLASENGAATVAAVCRIDPAGAAELLGDDPTADALDEATGECVAALNETLDEHRRIDLYLLREAPLPRDKRGAVDREALAREIEENL